MCDYQEAVLTLTVAVADDANQMLSVTTNVYSGQPAPLMVQHSTATGLLPNATYDVLAEVETSVGGSYKSIMFGEQE